ncbi:MAG TPA: ribbon-helix-helix protein, CopG family [Candidatus Limnocylindria bacterium]
MARTSARAPRVEQLSVGFDIDPIPIGPEPASDTMRQIVSIRMPDALVERVETVAKARGVSPSSLMRALIAAGLDRSYAALTESEAASDLAAELAALRQRVEDIAASLAADRPS